MEAGLTAVSRWAKSVVTTLSKPPPKLFFPSFVNFKGFFAKFKEAERADGFWRAYNKTRMESTLRKGTLVGTDANGNKYYEDRNAPYGRTRWVEYPTPAGIWHIEMKYDGSMVRGSRALALVRTRTHKTTARQCWPRSLPIIRRVAPSFRALSCRLVRCRLCALPCLRFLTWFSPRVCGGR